MIGQGLAGVVYPSEATGISSAAQARQVYGRSSPLARMAEILKPPDRGGLGSIPLTAYALQEPPAAVAAAGLLGFAPFTSLADDVVLRITVGGFVLSGLSLPAGTSAVGVLLSVGVFILDFPDIPVTPSFAIPNVALTAKWKGGSANGMAVHVDVLSGGRDKTWSTTPLSGGTPYADVQPALDAIGDKWETIVVNGSEPGDSAAFDACEAWGLARWGSVDARPAVVFTGQNDPSLANSVAVAAQHLEDRTNSMPIYGGSRETAWAIAAGFASQVAVVANENPARDFARGSLAPLSPGTPEQQFGYGDRDTAVTAGLSTTRLVAGAGQISDTVTFYHVVDTKVLTFPMSCGELLAQCGEPLAQCAELLAPPGVAVLGIDAELSAFRYVSDIMKLANCIYAIRQEFESADWNGAPIVADDQATVNPAARTVGAAQTALASIVDRLALSAIITDPGFAKGTIFADAASNKRLDLGLTVKISGVANITSVELGFGFTTG